MYILLGDLYLKLNSKLLCICVIGQWRKLIRYISLYFISYILLHIMITYIVHVIRTESRRFSCRPRQNESHGMSLYDHQSQYINIIIIVLRSQI